MKICMRFCQIRCDAIYFLDLEFFLFVVFISFQCETDVSTQVKPSTDTEKTRNVPWSCRWNRQSSRQLDRHTNRTQKMDRPTAMSMNNLEMSTGQYGFTTE